MSHVVVRDKVLALLCLSFKHSCDCDLWSVSRSKKGEGAPVVFTSPYRYSAMCVPGSDSAAVEHTPNTAKLLLTLTSQK